MTYLWLDILFVQFIIEAEFTPPSEGFFNSLDSCVWADPLGRSEVPMSINPDEMSTAVSYL